MTKVKTVYVDQLCIYVVIVGYKEHRVKWKVCSKVWLMGPF